MFQEIPVRSVHEAWGAFGKHPVAGATNDNMELQKGVHPKNTFLGGQSKIMYTMHSVLAGCCRISLNGIENAPIG